MSLPWVKLHTGLLDNDRFQRLSPEARLTFYTALAYAGKLEADGALAIPGIGPASPADFARYTGLAPRAQLIALNTLVAVGFLEHDPVTGLYSVARWSEKAGVTVRVGNAERQRRHRSRNASVTRYVTGNVTPGVTPPDKDKDKDKPTASEPTNPEKPKGPPPADLAAYLILDAIYPVVLERHPDLGMSRDKWRKSNKAAALDFAVQMKTPEQVVAVLRAAYGHEFAGFHGITQLDKLAKNWATLVKPMRRGFDYPKLTAENTA